MLVASIYLLLCDELDAGASRQQTGGIPCDRKSAVSRGAVISNLVAGCLCLAVLAGRAVLDCRHQVPPEQVTPFAAGWGSIPGVV